MLEWRPMTLPPEETTPERVGGKAAVLFELERAGFRIPKTYCDPPDLAAAVASISGPIAVRSSATCEDGRVSSFAGQFESFLGLRTLAEVREAVARCQASVRAPTVVEYCRQHGIPPEQVRMRVIVQEQIDPELAGVAFSVNPVTGREEVVVEAVAGLAEDLLAGRAQPLPAGDPLLERHRGRIEEAARAVQRHFGAPQDIEFAIRDGELYLLQARPITRISFDESLGEWTNADFRDGGVSSDVCTPLMWSLYDTVLEEGMPAFFRSLRLLGPQESFQAGAMFFGRPYWNLGAVKRCLARLPGFVERDFDEDLSIEVAYEGPGRVTPFTVRGLLRALPTVRAVGRVFRETEARNRAFLEGGFAALEQRFAQVPCGDDREAFAQLIEEGYRVTEGTYFQTIYCASIAKSDFCDAFPDVDYPALVSGLPPLKHLEPTRAMRAMARRGETDITPLLERFRHHSRRELDLRVPRWDEDPEHVRALLASFRDAPPAEDPVARYREVRARTRAGLPFWRRRAFDRKLDRLRRFLWMREELRDCSCRIYYLIRRYVLAIAEARGLGDDIFFMTWREVIDDDRSEIEARKATYESYRNFIPPNEIGARYREAAGTAAGALRGIAAARGRAEGTARVARSVEEALSVERGAILVCPFTDPGWTPVLDRVAGVVTETGGLLSHAAVICREYGIPAVLAVKDATQRIPDGSRIVIDGGQGSVELAD
ncbi:MAG: hypothetical protein D6731_00890 [Planctomycetota bacterium]|nr:MAG: hypothetical protein D6731_00890 [Planctomycetota bacterium]